MNIKMPITLQILNKQGTPTEIFKHVGNFPSLTGALKGV